MLLKAQGPPTHRILLGNPPRTVTSAMLADTCNKSTYSSKKLLATMSLVLKQRNLASQLFQPFWFWSHPNRDVSETEYFVILFVLLMM